LNKSFAVRTKVAAVLCSLAESGWEFRRRLDADSVSTSA
jgi:hypothetical protein